MKTRHRAHSAARAAEEFTMAWTPRADRDGIELRRCRRPHEIHTDHLWTTKAGRTYHCRGVGLWRLQNHQFGCSGAEQLPCVHNLDAHNAVALRAILIDDHMLGIVRRNDGAPVAEAVRS